MVDFKKAGPFNAFPLWSSFVMAIVMAIFHEEHDDESEFLGSNHNWAKPFQTHRCHRKPAGVAWIEGGDFASFYRGSKLSNNGGVSWGSWCKNNLHDRSNNDWLIWSCILRTFSTGVFWITICSHQISAVLQTSPEVLVASCYGFTTWYLNPELAFAIVWDTKM